MAYWDTACLVKLYVVESDSAVFRMHVRNGATVVTCEIARMELWTAFRRKEAVGDLGSGGARAALDAFDDDVSAGRVVVNSLDSATDSEFETLIETCYTKAPPVLLRTLDAIHLAAARTSQETEIVTTDGRMRAAAPLLGFSLFPVP